MSYVPIVPYVPPSQQASPRARELGVQMAQLLQEFQKQNPSLSPSEVRMAMQIAQQASGVGTSSPKAVVVVSLTAGLLALALGALVFLRGSGEGFEISPTIFPMIGVIALLLVVLGFVAVVRNQ